MVWRTILIGVVLTALLFLAFSVWIAIGQYENGHANPSMVVIARQVLQLSKSNQRKEMGMAADLTKRGPADRSQINVQQDYEVEYWCRELSATPHELRLLVQQHVTSVDKIRDVLGQAKSA